MWHIYYFSYFSILLKFFTHTKIAYKGCDYSKECYYPWTTAAASPYESMYDSSKV